MKVIPTITTVIFTLLFSLNVIASNNTDHWRNATIYFLLTDRFVDANPDNNNSYGRKLDGTYNIGTFHGGDFKGITRRLKQGYFSDLGVTAIWITSPFEQIHGWIPGGNKEFKHYSYHGYYTLDYTTLDKNFGTEKEFSELINEAHKQGIRIILDVVLNHPGYSDLQTMSDLNVDVVKQDWRNSGLKDYHAYIDYNSNNWDDWWGPDWIRAKLPDHDIPGSNHFTESLFFLPDFKTESLHPVSLPTFLTNKKDTKVVSIEGFTVSDYLIHWLSDWVREYGIDGFRIDAAKHLDSDTLARLSASSKQAYRDWKKSQDKPPFPNSEFWLVGESFGHKLEESRYSALGIDAMLNFEFYSKEPVESEMEYIYTKYSNFLHSHKNSNSLSFLSSHDTGMYSSSNIDQMAKYFFFLPGAIQIFYGDETGREATNYDITDTYQNFRSDMNWKSINIERLTYWQTLGKLRKRFPQIGAGIHKQISTHPFIFTRELNGTTILIAFDTDSEHIIDIQNIFDSNEVLLNTSNALPAHVVENQLYIPAHRGIQIFYVKN